ncbi:hypothetical protein CPB85DRAFT_97922 [Mucidula mucida]|nr:hypothetical protein CPB85DRAFT_97922 [Mucidula mucida]
MSTSPVSAEFKVLSSRIREIETALDQVFDELDEAAIAPTASTLKDLLARRRDCRPTRRYQHTAYNPLKTADLQRPRRNHQESCRDQKNQRGNSTGPRRLLPKRSGLLCKLCQSNSYHYRSHRRG